MSIFSAILSIFVDDMSKKKILPLQKSFFNHYKQQLETIYFDEIIVACEYESIKFFLEEYKFHSERDYAEEFIKYLLSSFDSSKLWKNVAVVPIPMHWSRYYIRGFDHIHFLAEKFSKKVQIPVFPILRTKFTRRQVGKQKKWRFKNRKSAYFLKKNITLPETVILLDDVVTTAATVNAASKILKNAGVKYILVLALATNQK